jgi:hypothetical protein
MVIIDLGGPDAPAPPPRDRPAPPRRWRSWLLAALVLAAYGLAGAAPSAGPRLEGPLWTGTVSLNGFSLGPDSLYQTSPDAAWASGRDLATGGLRWRLAIDGQQPESIADVGAGVAAVTTRGPGDGDRRGEYALTLVREATGAVVGRTTGYFFRPGVPGAPLVVVGRCAGGSCVELTGWDVRTASARWRVRLAPGATAVPWFAPDGTFARIAEVGADGAVRLIDVVTGTPVAGALPARQAVLTREVLVTAATGGGEVVVTAYRRPTLERIWSVTVAAPAGAAEAGPAPGGAAGLTDCGSMVGCLYPAFLAGRIIGTPAGSGRPQTRYRLVHGIGQGLFLARSAANPPTTPPYVEYIVDRTGQVRGTLPVRTAVPWSDAGGRTLTVRTGPHRTEFLVADDGGRPRGAGSVPGTNLTCAARGGYLACADPGGRLRVWRIRR